jgi:hypothetical protein
MAFYREVSRPPARRIVLWILAMGVAGVAAFAGVTMWVLRPAWIAPRLTAMLSSHLNLETTIDEVSVTLWPRPRISGAGLVMRVPGRPDLPPFIAIGHFWVDAGPLTVWKQRVGTVHLDGLKIAVPPSEVRSKLPGGSDSSSKDVTASKVIVDHLVTHDAVLLFVPRRADRPPLTFRIHELKLDDLGFERAMPFYTKLTNPVPTGLVETRGSFGPWRRDSPGETPISGEYTLSNADLSTINGIGGILQSKGKYEGRLTRVNTVGEADTKDFSLDLGGKPVPLHTRFHTIVDATDGSTRLERVDAKLRNTSFSTSGDITNLSGPGRHAIDLEFDIHQGRIEDLLALSIDAPQPLLTGDVKLQGRLSLPPGPTKVRKRLKVSGRFDLARGMFTDPKVQEKLQELSRRSQGKAPDEDPGRVLTNMTGSFVLQSGVLSLPDLTFQVPGASVNLAGQYQIDGEVIDFRGTLKMKATVSQAVGGFKSIFLKPFDALFREKGHGAVVPIKIAGTRKEPKMAIEMGKVFK